MNKPILDVLAGRNLAVPPLWMMRQAGRYLPEYRALRAMAGSFLDLALTPDFATEVTLQPIRRFGFDAAILFSDILIVPMAMGRSLRFVEGEGPRLDPLDISDGYIAGNVDSAVFAPVYETVRRVKAALPDPVALLGFCGAPWTVATYVIAGRGTPDQGPARMAAYRHPEAFEALIRAIEAVSIDYLVGQLQAGADAVQIFDSWAGILPPAEFARWAIDPARRICDGVRARVPGARFIGFPRAAGTQLGAYCRYVPVQAVGLDWTENAEFVRQAVPAGMAVQGNLDPLALMAGGAALDRAVDAILNDYRERPFIFNLGHGILPETPIAHVETMIPRVRGA